MGVEWESCGKKTNLRDQMWRRFREKKIRFTGNFVQPLEDIHGSLGGGTRKPGRTCVIGGFKIFGGKRGTRSLGGFRHPKRSRREAPYKHPCFFGVGKVQTALQSFRELTLGQKELHGYEEGDGGKGSGAVPVVKTGGTCGVAPNLLD